MKALTRLFDTDDTSWPLLVSRVVLGLVILPHGLQKLVGAFGGYGFSGTMGYLTGTVGLPAPVAFLVIVGESIGAALLVVGLLSRVGALLIAATMIGAAVTAHLSHGFFMNWFGNQGGEGFEYHLLALGLAVPVVLFGGGRFAVDSALARILAAPARRLATTT